MLSIFKDDYFSIRVLNELQDTSMPLLTSVVCVLFFFLPTRFLIPLKHWHGIHQLKTNWADGTAFITQCPIPQYGSFLYQFSAPGQTGTYWFVLFGLHAGGISIIAVR